MEGGVPIVIDGKVVGGIGVSGVHSKDDAQIAQAGADAGRLMHRSKREVCNHSITSSARASTDRGCHAPSPSSG